MEANSDASAKAERANTECGTRIIATRFNLEIAGADPATWCATVSVIMEKMHLPDNELYFAISRALEGTTAQWFTQVPVRSLTWTTFTEHFLAHYVGTETATATLMRIYNEPPLKNETTGAFDVRLRALLWAKWKNLTNDEIINAVVLYRLILHDQSVERIALTKDIQTRDQFFKEMRVSFHARKRLVPSSNNPSAKPEIKRHKPSAHHMRCLYCGKHGHKLVECTRRMRNQQRKSAQRQEGSQPVTPSKVIC